MRPKHTREESREAGRRSRLRTYHLMMVCDDPRMRSTVCGRLRAKISPDWTLRLRRVWSADFAWKKQMISQESAVGPRRPKAVEFRKVQRRCHKHSPPRYGHPSSKRRACHSRQTRAPLRPRRPRQHQPKPCSKHYRRSEIIQPTN